MADQPEDSAGDPAAVLSDVDDIDDTDPSLIVLPSPSSAAEKQLRRRSREDELLAELELERSARRAAEEAQADLQSKFHRLRDLAREAIRKRDEALRSRDEASSQQSSLSSEADAAVQMLISGIEKISGKISAFKTFSNGLPQSQKYASGLQAVAYGVIKRANEIVEELVMQIEAASSDRDRAREQMEHRNYEIAIEVSQLEATISGLRDEVLKKNEDVDRLEKLVVEKDGRIGEFDAVLSKLKLANDECEAKVQFLEAKLDAQRPVLIDHMNYISKAYGHIQEIIGAVHVGTSDQLDFSDSLLMSQDSDMEENLRTSLRGLISVFELSKDAVEKVTEAMEERQKEAEVLNERIERLLGEKQHIGTLLRSALSSKANEVLQVAEDGLREAGIDLRLNEHDSSGLTKADDDEVYSLAGALETTVKASQLKIVELQHLVEALRAESSLLKARLDAQAKEISQQKYLIKELEEKERLASENVEGLMMDIAAAEEEIARWKAAAEQEAAAGRAVEQEFLTQLAALRKELGEAKHALVESENKLKYKEETATAAMVARDAAETSLKLADLRSTRLRVRVEELTRQLEESDGRREDFRNRSGVRYVCWPWQWLGLNFVRYQTDAQAQQGSNEMELSEPLI